jgi:hypothetical protein
MFLDLYDSFWFLREFESELVSSEPDGNMNADMEGTQTGIQMNLIGLTP